MEVSTCIASASAPPRSMCRGLVSGDGARGDEPVLGLRPRRAQHSGHRCLRGAPGREHSPGTARKTPPHTQAPAQDLGRSCGRKCATVGRTGTAGCDSLILRGRGTLLNLAAHAHRPDDFQRTGRRVTGPWHNQPAPKREDVLVETSGLEPPTPCLQSRCSTS